MPRFHPRLLWLLGFWLFGCTGSQAQPLLDWDMTFGGENYEELNGLRVAKSGIYLGGSTKSNLAFGTVSDTSWNILLGKTDFDGQLLWNKMVGGDRHDRLWELIVTKDGGLLAGGYSFSNVSGQKSEPSRGGMDVWVIRMDANGQILWDRTYGGTGRDELFSILELPEGGFILGCHSNSPVGGEKSEPCRGELDFWLLGIDPNGNLLWDKTIGGDKEDQIHDVLLLPSGNVLASGGTVSTRNTGEVGSDFARGAKDYWILEYNPANKQVLWNHRFGGTSDDFAYALHRTPTGKIFLGGRSASNVAPPTAINNGKDAPFYGGASDYWLLELDAQGVKKSEWGFGGAGLDDLYYIEQNARGDLILGGVTDSPISGNKTTPLRGGYDFWVIGIDTTGQMLWQKTIGGSNFDALTKIQTLPNGALVFGGHSQSDTGFEKSEDAYGVNDFWVVTTLCLSQVNIHNTSTSFCSTEQVELTAQVTSCNSCLYQWNTGATTTSIEVPPGTKDTFTVQVMDEYGCVAYDTLYLDTPQPPVVQIGPSDTLIQQGQTLVLGQPNPQWTYIWNTGETTSTIEVENTGNYIVTITDLNGCTATDHILVRVRRDFYLYAPNAFSPDLDGYNDYFTLYTNDVAVQILDLQIADRWGELVYRKKKFLPNNDLDGWDGRYRGKWAEVGVYLWSAEILLDDGEQYHYEGSITIIR